jgi:DNA-binding MarR family transcriptional regulator
MRVRTELKSARIRNIAEHFADDPSIQIDHMIASASIFRAYKVVAQRMEAVLAEYDLNMSRFEILGDLAADQNGRVSITDLKRMTLLHSATMSYNIDILENRKLIRRRPDPADRRAFIIEITKSGRSLLDGAQNALDGILYGVGELSVRQCWALTGVLTEIHGFESTANAK